MLVSKSSANDRDGNGSVDFYSCNLSPGSSLVNTCKPGELFSQLPQRA